MSLPNLHISIVVGENSDLEALALRATLEYFGARVTTHWIGRPNDFISVLNGIDRANRIDYLILSFHGEDGAFCLPELGEEVYEVDEPQVTLFTANHVRKFAQLQTLKVIGAGCTLGDSQLAASFLNAGVEWYLAPKDYIDGNANYLFLSRFFYELVNHNRSDDDAFQLAKGIDEETALYELYRFNQ